MLTVDLAAILANHAALAARCPGARTAAVVKADAYGLGADRVVPALAGAGVRDFFVAQAAEGRRLRPLVPAGARIFVMSGPLPGDDMTGLIPVLNSAFHFFSHRASTPGKPFAIQLDTGMNRLGIRPSPWAAIRADVLAAGPALIMSHLACADDPGSPENARQLALFRAMTAGIGDVPRSLAATGGILLGPEYHFDLVRPGIGLYGGAPFAAARPVVRLDLPVIQTRMVPAGEFVGYSATWRAERATRVATVAGGYADGLLRALSGSGAMLWAGDVGCPIVGRVSMDLITCDVTDADPPPAALTILGPGQGIDALAARAATIGYEILTSLGPRYPRRYIGD